MNVKTITPVQTSTSDNIVRTLTFGDVANITEQFIKDQDVKELSANAYRRNLNHWFEWIIKNEKIVSDLTRSDVLEYKQYLLKEGFAPLTICSYLTTVRRFYSWTESNKYYPNIASGVKNPKRKQEYKKLHLPEDKIAELLDHFRGESLRDFAIVNLMIRTGLRCVEVVRLDIGDLDEEGGRRILRIWGKGKDTKDDFVVLTDKAFEPLNNYILSRGRCKVNEPLFASADWYENNGGRLTTRSISRIVKNGLVSIGLNGRQYTAHSLRHTTAVEILRNGGQLTDVQDVLRHASPTTSQIYTESIKKELRIKNAPEELIKW